MFGRGGRLAVAVLSRQLTAEARPIAFTCRSPKLLPNDESKALNIENVFKRDFSSQVIGGPVDEEHRRIILNRILYRSKQRGYLELDLLLGKWVHENIIKLDDAQLGALVEVLDEENPDLWKWLSGQDQVPDKFQSNAVFTAIHKKVQERLEEHTSVETRARPGSPWVRGWDDIGKVGSSKIGNQ